MEQGCQAAPIGILEIDPDGVVREANQAAIEYLAADAGSVAGTSISEVFPDSVAARVPRAFRTPPTSEQQFEEYYPGPDRWLSVTVCPADAVVYLYVEDTTNENRQTQHIDSLRDDVERQAITNELVGDVLAELVAASSRAEIAETVCTTLGETDLYEFAWMGERELGTDALSSRAAAGTTNRTFEQIEAALEAGQRLPEFRAVERSAPVIVNSISDDESIPEGVRRAAFADGLQSLLAVPLTYGSNVYGVVGVYTAQENAFSERERRNFGTVGNMVGFAINATRHRSLLLSDTVVELTFQLSDTDAPLVAASMDDGVELSVRGLIPDGDQLICFLHVAGTAPREISSSLAAIDRVESTRVVTDAGASGSLETTLSVETPLGALLSQGGSLQSASYCGVESRIVVELPPDEDIRRIADAFTRQFEAEVLAKREREREQTTAQEFRDSLHDRLTERQENALRTALFADYFQSPRASTAEEVAGTLGITSPTLLHHLRAGQRKLLEEFFETTE